MQILNPPGLPRARGFSHGVIAPSGSRMLFVAGQIAADEEDRVVGDDLASQFDKALENALAVVRAAGGGPEHVVRLNAYLTDKNAYLASLREIGAVYRERMGRHYPAMAWVEVASLVLDAAMIEVELTAALPPESDEESS